ncbi:MAG: hypothetical protein JSW35_07755 [Deltaproteobacteria bacterium]|nr:MAG: hypothetical protein JSW35_07755 [Deltaproteobacteria bacterium]
MSRLIFTLFIILTTWLNVGCFNNSGKAPQDSAQIIGDVDLYTFSPSDRYLLSDAEPLILPSSTSVKDTLERLGRDLAQNYFSKTYIDKATDIHFEVLRIDEIATPSRPLRIAVVNMVDTKRAAMRYFFQGSAGGQTTFYMLAATFLQPHLSPPLLDGLILLYNGKILPELDHISLTGILIPKSAQHVAQRAIHGTRRKAIISHEDWVKLRKLRL